MSAKTLFSKKLINCIIFKLNFLFIVTDFQVRVIYVFKKNKMFNHFFICRELEDHHKTSHEELPKRNVGVTQSLCILYICRYCTYETTSVMNLKQHEMAHKSGNEGHSLKCERCPFRTKQNYLLRGHKILHKRIDELDKNKKQFVYKEQLVHKVEFFKKCDQCAYISKSKKDLELHDIFHKKFVEHQLFQCGRCCYRTKKKSDLENHYSLDH